MKHSRPPAVASWLSEHFVSNQALAGDLAEEYQRGRSGFWYWRQMLVAINAGVYRGIRDHRMLAIRAVVTGFVTLRLLHVLTGSLDNSLMDWVQDRLHDGLTRPNGTWTSDAAGHFMVWFAVYLRDLPVLCAVYLISGWLVGQLHRSQRIAMVFAFALVVLGQSIFLVAFQWTRWRLQWEPYPVLALLWGLTTLLMPVLVVVGGSLVAHTVRSIQQETHDRL